MEALEEIILRHANEQPTQLLSSKLETNSIPVRSFLFALENLISQQKYRFSSVVEKYFRSASYKYSAPHRHQQFWKHFRRLKSLLCKYNRPDFFKVLNELHKRLSQSVTQSYYYMPTPETLRFIGATFLEQLYLLQKLRDSCIKAADTMLGYIDIGHWENLGIFILGLCAELFQQIPVQVGLIAGAYDSMSEFLAPAESSFPSKSAEIPLVARLIKVEPSSHADPRRVLKLLRLTDEQLDEAVAKNELNKSKSQAHRNLNTYLESTIDLGVDVSRDEDLNADLGENTTINENQISKKTKKKRRKLEEFSTLEASCLEITKQESIQVEKSAAVKLKRMKILEPRASSTPLAFKKKKKKIMDVSISSINTETDATPVPKNLKKKLKKTRKVEASVLLADTTVQGSLRPLKKKKKGAKLFD